jgi:MFS family permease
VLGLFAAGVVVLAIWVWVEMHVEEPLVDMKIMRERPVFTTNLTALFVGFGMFGSFILIPQFVQAPLSTGYGFGASVTAAGLFLLPSALVMLPAGPISGSLGERYGSKMPLLAGALLASVAYGFLAVAHADRWEIYAATTLLGLGIGFAFAAMANLIVEAVPQDQTGVATGINTIARTIGGALGAQISATILAGHLLTSGYPAESGYTAAFAMSAAGVLAAFLVGLAIPARRRQPAALAHEAA